MKKLILFLLVMLVSLSASMAQGTTIKTVAIYEASFGSKTKTPMVGASKAGGNVYDSVIVTVPYGECPLFDVGPSDSTYARFGDHIISVQAPNDSITKGKVDSTYIEVYLEFLTPDGYYINGGLVLTKTWAQSASATNTVIPPNPLMRMSFLRARLYIKIYQGYKKTISNVKVYKYYKPKKG